MNITLFFGILVLIFIGILGFIARLQILNFFRPDLFLRIYFFYKDGFIGNWLQYRNNLTSKSWKYNKETYLYGTNYYNSGRNKALLYVEGNPIPIRFEKMNYDYSAEMLHSFTETKISDMFEVKKGGLAELISENRSIIIIGIIAIVIIVLFVK